MINFDGKYLVCLEKNNINHNTMSPSDTYMRQ